MIKGASLHFDEIITSKNLFIEGKEDHLTKEKLGMSIRRWGPQWRSSVAFALCVESTEVLDTDSKFSCGSNVLIRSISIQICQLSSITMPCG